MQKLHTHLSCLIELGSKSKAELLKQYSHTHHAYGNASSKGPLYEWTRLPCSVMAELLLWAPCE